MEPLKKKQKQANSYIRYAGISTQMAVTIGLFAFVGVKLDSYFSTEKPICTALFALLGVMLAIFVLIREVQKDRADEGDIIDYTKINRNIKFSEEEEAEENQQE